MPGSRSPTGMPEELETTGRTIVSSLGRLASYSSSCAGARPFSTPLVGQDDFLLRSMGEFEEDEEW